MAYLAEIVKWITAGVTAVVDGTPRTAASVNAGLTDLANRTRWLKDRMYDLLLGEARTISAANTTTYRLTVTSHGIPANTAVQVFAANGGTLPGGLAVATVYYVNVIDANTIELSASSGPGAAVVLTAGFSGDCYVQPIQDWMSVLLVADSTWGYGKLSDLIVFKAGSQAITGAKTVSDITLSGTTNIKVATRTITRALAVTWVYSGTKAGLTLQEPTIVAGDVAYAEFELPHGQTLKNVTITIHPAAVGALPGTPPSFNGSAWDVTTGAAAGAGFGPINDPSVDAAAYNLVHDISSGTLTETIVGTSRIYSVSLTNGTATSIDIVGLRATVEASSITEWN